MTVIPAQESDRTRIGATCSRAFKGRVEDYAQRHGRTVAEVVIRALCDLLVAEELAGGQALPPGQEHRQDGPLGGGHEIQE